MSHHRDSKHYYLGYVKVFYRKDFPDLLSYTRFLEVMPRTIAPVCLLWHIEGKAYRDCIHWLYSLQVCHNIGIPCHKTMDGVAQRGKGTMEQGDALKTFLNPSRVNYLVFIEDIELMSFVLPIKAKQWQRLFLLNLKTRCDVNIAG